MAKRTQSNRIVSINTPLGEDVLLARSLSIREELGRPFQIDADLLSENHEVDFEQVVGKPAAIRLELGDGSQRYFHGLIAQFSQEGRVGELTAYRATIVPWVWLLTKNTDCAIYQNKTVPDIVQAIFGRYPDGKFSLGLSGDYQPREYVVEYRETDFNFVSRLLEHEGIAYYFEHAEDNHTLVLTDNPGAYSEFPGYEKIRFSTGGFDRGPQDQRISALTLTSSVTPAMVCLRDFNPLLPQTDLQQATTAETKGALGQIFDYPGDFATAREGEAYAKLRYEELRVPHRVIRGTANARGIAVGRIFEILEAPRADLNGKKWLVTSASYQITGDDYGASGGGHGETFSVSFTAMEHTTQFRPARTTPRPTIPGPQTAIVVGVSGEEITVDEHGRVKVQFHWDRYAKGDENDSCWIRVAQSWAGKSYGSIYTPRHGQEVVVEFLEGDPDRPIITGRVYNGANQPPYALPDSKTCSGVRTSSSKGGAGFNEIRFEDKAGEEMLFLHAAMNLDVHVEKDARERVMENQHLLVEKDRIGQIKHDDHLKVDNDSVTEIGQDLHLKVTGKAAMEIGGSRSLKVTGADASEFGANVAQKITGKLFIDAAGVTIEASSGITLKCGGNSVVIDSAGVTVKGSMVTIDGSLTKINSGPGSPPVPGSPGSLVAPTAPKTPDEAFKGELGGLEEAPGAREAPDEKWHFDTINASSYHTPASAAAEDAPAHWIEIAMKDDHGHPMAGEPFVVILPNGETAATGTLDENGRARVEGLDPGQCKIRFPQRESDGWNPR